MHIHKFCEIASFEEIGIGGLLPADEEYKTLIRNLHPSQIISSEINFPMHRIDYSYITNRGNYKTSSKYLFTKFIDEESSLEISMRFEQWVLNFNEANPYRRISNVQILDINPLAYANIYIK